MSDTHMDKAAREKAREHLGEYATPFRETLRGALAALDAADSERFTLQLQIDGLLEKRDEAEERVDAADSDNARLRARVAELEAALAHKSDLLNQRDDFIVDEDLWNKFVKSIELPEPPVGDK